MRYGFAYGGLFAAGIAFALATISGAEVKADAPDDTVVARVGAQTVTAGELERRLLQIPPFQLRMFGKTEAEIKRNFLERVIVRDMLFAQGALDEKLDSQESVEERVRATLRSVIVQQVRMEAQSAPITDSEIAKYYADNADKYRAPERIAVWRILVATQEEALKVVADLKKDNSIKRWNELARERSLDKATNMRGGNLGYVALDGKTADPAIVVEQSVLELVKVLKDAELSPLPVKELDKWAVVWRRQTMKAVDRSLEQETPGIKQTLARQRTEEKIKAVLDKAREERARDVSLDLVDEVTVSAQGDLQPLKRPGVLPSRRVAPGQPAPGHDHR